MKRKQFCVVCFLIFRLSFPLYCQVDFTASQVKGCDTLTVKFTLLTTVNSPKVLWNFGNGNTSNEINPPPVFYNKPGSYTVSVSVNDSLTRTKPRYIQVRPSPVAHFQYADSSVSGSFIYTFSSMTQPVDTALYSYEWKIQGADTSYTTPYVTYEFDSTGLYRVTLYVMDDFGCRDTFSRLVNVSTALYVPNVFTPNEDGINDLFLIPADGLTLYRLLVFTRYGILIYKTESKYPSWDGRNSAGVKMPEGIYYYTIEVLQPQNSATRSGFVYLLR